MMYIRGGNEERLQKVQHLASEDSGCRQGQMNCLSRGDCGNFRRGEGYEIVTSLLEDKK